MKNVRCNLCGRDDWRLRYPATGRDDGLVVDAFRCTSPHYGTHPQIVQCRNCGHVYANPVWKSEALMEAYQAVEDQVYLDEQASRKKTFIRHLQAMERFTGPAEGRSLLDVGAYIGVFVDVARSSGWDALGVEPSTWASQAAEERGLPVIQGDLSAKEIQDRRFDAITMWDVIEHMADPLAELIQANRLLRTGGIVAVHTMNIDSPLARLMGPRWPWLMDMHIHYFSMGSLAQMLEKAGFDVLWSGAQGRYLSLGYLASRVKAINGTVGLLLERLFQRGRLAQRSVPVNLGDLFTTFARKNDQDR